MKKNKKYDIAVIFLHPGCNMTCNFCITENGFDSMTEIQAMNLLAQLKEQGFKNVVFGGGEPFTWRGDLIKLTQIAKEMGFIVQVGTNAIALPDSYETISSIDRYVLPLESVEQKIHNSLRFYRKTHHQIIMNCLNTLKAAYKTVTISTIVTKKNIDQVNSLANFLEELNSSGVFIHAWHLYNFIPQGRGGKVNAQSLLVSRSKFMHLVNEVKDMGLSFSVYKRDNMYESKTVDFFWYENNQLQAASVLNQNNDTKSKAITVPFVAEYEQEPSLKSSEYLNKSIAS